MAPLPSRGPTNEGRIKPDVVAPGTNILPVRSHAPGAQELIGASDENHVFCSSTSMATPLVAGVVTHLRQWYVDQQGAVSPSAALIAATLINGATDYRGSLVPRWAGMGGIMAALLALIVALQKRKDQV